MFDPGGKILEWAVGIITTLFVFVFGYVLRSHGRRIENSEQCLVGHGESIARLNQCQQGFQERMQERMERGERLFERNEERQKEIKASLAAFNSAISKLEGINKAMEERLRVLDERIYSHQGDRKR